MAVYHEIPVQLPAGQQGGTLSVDVPYYPAPYFAVHNETPAMLTIAPGSVEDPDLSTNKRSIGPYKTFSGQWSPQRQITIKWSVDKPLDTAQHLTVAFSDQPIQAYSSDNVQTLVQVGGPQIIIPGGGSSGISGGSGGGGSLQHITFTPNMGTVQSAVNGQQCWAFEAQIQFDAPILFTDIVCAGVNGDGTPIPLLAFASTNPGLQYPEESGGLEWTGNAPQIVTGYAVHALALSPDVLCGQVILALYAQPGWIGTPDNPTFHLWAWFDPSWSRSGIREGVSQSNVYTVDSNGWSISNLMSNFCRKVLIKNLDAANKVYIGDASVTPQNGYPLGPGESITFDVNARALTGSITAITDGPTVQIAVLELR